MYASTSSLRPLTRAPADVDHMEASLDGLSTVSVARTLSIRAMRSANEDPELIMLALRGLPLFPSPSVAPSPPSLDSAFIVNGGPTSLLREVCLLPYPHPLAPPQLYAALDGSRRLQNRSEFKPAIRALNRAMHVWSRKHMWSSLRDNPDMTLADALERDAWRYANARERASYQDMMKRKKDEEEREAARKLAAMGDNTEAAENEAAALAAAEALHQSQLAAIRQREDDEDAEADANGDEDEDDDNDDYDDEDDDGTHTHARRRARRRRAEAASLASSAALSLSSPAARHPHDLPEESLSYPSVSSECELEFLTFYYNALGGVYQSAAAASTAGGAVHCAGGDGSGGVRWGRMRVIPRAQGLHSLKRMIEGTREGTYLYSASPAYAHAAGTDIEDVDGDEESGSDDDGSDSDSETNVNPDEYIATSASSLSNSSDSRALIALWQSHRAHALYVQMVESARARAAADAREREAEARGAAGGGAKNRDDDDMLDDLPLDDGKDKASTLGISVGSTTLGHAAFAALNIPNLSLSQLQSESKAMGLFGFPHVQTSMNARSASGGAPIANSAANGGMSSQSSQDRAQSHLFWSTQPIIMATFTMKGHVESSRNLFAGAGGAQQNAANANLAASSLAAGGISSIHPPAQLLAPYLLCSASDAVTYSNLGTCLFHLSCYPLSLRCFYVSLQIRCATLRPNSDEYVDVATSLNNIGVVLSSLSYFAPAWDYFQAALELAKTRLDIVHPRLSLMATNATKIQARRQGVLAAPGIIAELRMIAEGKERKEAEQREKRSAKSSKKAGAGGGSTATGGKASPGAAPTGSAARSGSTTSAGSARAGSSGGGSGSAKTGRGATGKKGELEKPKEFHEDARFFQERAAGQPPIIPVPSATGLPLPLGSAAASITTMPLRHWDVNMGEFQKLLLEFGPAKKKAGGKTGGKGKKGKSKKK